MRTIALYIATIRRFFELFKSPPKPDPIILLLDHMVKQSERQNILMADAIKGVVSASAKQADVLQSYLSLFKGDKEPERWVQNEAEQNKEELLQAGFPMGGTEAEQAEWILKTM